MKAGQAVDAALAGAPGAVDAYVARLEGIWAAYLRRHRLAYRAERRWLDSPFWKRRQPGAGILQPAIRRIGRQPAEGGSGRRGP